MEVKSQQIFINRIHVRSAVTVDILQGWTDELNVTPGTEHVCMQQGLSQPFCLLCPSV